ncbi:MAG: MoaD/ThiS family protein [Egibacteraceae bacterium]
MDAAERTAGTVRLRIVMPHQLRALARVTGEVAVGAAAPITVRTALDALEAAYPALVGTIRERDTGHRRAMIRIYVAGEDLSNAPVDTPLPAAVTSGREPLQLVGAIAGG